MNDEKPTTTGLKGVANEISGKAKEMAGNVVGNDDLSQEGEAQQDRAQHERDAAKEEARAEKSKAEAEVDAKRQEVAAENRF